MCQPKTCRTALRVAAAGNCVRKAVKRSLHTISKVVALQWLARHFSEVVRISGRGVINDLEREKAAPKGTASPTPHEAISARRGSDIAYCAVRFQAFWLDRESCAFDACPSPGDRRCETDTCARGGADWTARPRRRRRLIVINGMSGAGGS